jgi:hypothetical protein
LHRLLPLVFVLAFAPIARSADDALDEVNAARAARGLPPFARDPGLTSAAQAAADHRAQYFIAGHIGGGMGDFGFLPPGIWADAAGCGAMEASWGWNTCCTYEHYQSAGAAVAWGRDGRRYMHLFVRRGGPIFGQPAVTQPVTTQPVAMQPVAMQPVASQPETAASSSSYAWPGQPMWTYPGSGYMTTGQPTWSAPSRTIFRRGFRR